jgi:hypothetical protein
MGSTENPDFNALTVRAHYDKPQNAVSMWFAAATGPHVVNLAWDSLGHLTDQLLAIQASPPIRRLLQLSGPADYILPEAREYVCLVPPVYGQEAKIRLSILPGISLDIPLSRESLRALESDLAAHLQRYSG